LVRVMRDKRDLITDETSCGGFRARNFSTGDVVKVRPKTVDVVHQNLAYLRLLGRSEKTEHLRAGTLRRLDEYLAGTDILRATEEQLEGFLSLPSKCQDTRAVEVSHLRQFYKWATAKGIVKKDPTLLLPSPKKKRRLPRPTPIESAATAIEMGTGDRPLILSLACLSGLRADEIARLEGTDVDWSYDPPLMWIRGKGDKERRVPAPPQLARLLAGAPRTGPLIRYKDPKKAQQHVPAWLVSQRANQYLHSLGLPSVHKLRHTAATWFYRESGYDLLLTQQFLGHSSPTSTAVYAKVEPARMAEVSRGLELPFAQPARQAI
jgi:integrase